MIVVTSFRVLGSHDGPRPGTFDGADLVLDTDDGERVLGFRTAAYVEGARRDGDPADWSAGYTPLPITLDVDAVEFWDFNQVMWLGPEPHPCLVWSNAEGISLLGLGHLVAPVGSGAVLAGPDGRGLPTPDDLGISVPDGLATHPSALP